ncbi:MAG: MBL fold metallo-hydrolase [Spirochaetales bacterium]|nr:MBL fold metallo-hydrolase [Spirochaetales bacterium]
MINQIVVGICSTNCYIFSHKTNECVIIDPGGDEVDIISCIKALDVQPVGIILTHGHFDHTAAIKKLRDYFQKKGKKIPIAIHTEDRKYLGESGEKINKNFLSYFGLDSNNQFHNNFMSMPDADILLHDEENVFNTEMTVIETPGHTRGSVCLYSEEKNVLFSGDTLFCQGIGRTDFPDGDHESIVKSIRDRLFSLPADTIVYPGHGPSSTIRMEKESFYPS